MSLVTIREKNDNGNQDGSDASSTLNNTTHATNNKQDSSSSTTTCQVSLSQGEKVETETDATTMEDDDEWEDVEEEDDDDESDDMQVYDDGDEDVNYRLFEDDDDYNGFDGDEYDYDSITGSADLDQFMFEQGMKPWIRKM